MTASQRIGGPDSLQCPTLAPRPAASPRRCAAVAHVERGLLLAALVWGSALSGQAAADGMYAAIDVAAAAMEDQVVAWRRDVHEHPELSNREYRTARLVAAHLGDLELEVATGVSNTGVVGVLRGAKPGPVVALRADMDALPVVEQTGLPYASKVTGTYLGKEVGVMHACGHDNHVAILMGVASVLTGLRDELPGTVKFIFQPAEEGAPPGEESGAEQMVKEGVLENPDVDAIFALHVFQGRYDRHRELPFGRRHGERPELRDRDIRAADPRRPALGRRGPHRCRSADNHGPADHRQPPGGHHRLTRRGDGGHLRERDALQHRAGAERSSPAPSGPTMWKPAN